MKKLIYPLIVILLTNCSKNSDSTISATVPPIQTTNPIVVTPTFVIGSYIGKTSYELRKTKKYLNIDSLQQIFNLNKNGYWDGVNNLGYSYVDLNADGLDDIFYPIMTANTEVPMKPYIFINKGSSYSLDENIIPKDYIGGTDMRKSIVCDFNNDSLPDIFLNNTANEQSPIQPQSAYQYVMLSVKGNKTIEKGPLLITHWGISGPAAIKLSAWCARELANDNYEGAIVINWTPEYNEATLKMEWINLRMDFGKREMGSKNPFNLPQRLWQFLLQEAGIVLTTKWADLKSSQQQLLIQSLTRTTLTIKGKTTFKEEFVTCGGVELSEIEASTMESKLVPGLYFAGEMMDVDGITGGFNFQHAWTSGWTAAQAMGRMG
jgi:hypothetical protein